MKKVILYIGILLLFASNLYAQPLTNAERRSMNDKLLETIIRYESSSNFSTNSDFYTFSDLFRNSDAKVFCDYIASGRFGKTLSASDYADYSFNKVKVRFVEIRNVSKEDYVRFGDDFRVRVSFDKCIAYEDELGTYFRTEDKTVGGDFHITMDCIYDTHDETFYIESITGFENPDSKFPHGKFLIIEKKNDRDTLLHSVHFNEFNYAIVSGTKAPTFSDDDISTVIKETASTDRYSKIQYSYKITRMRAKVWTTLAPAFAYSVKSNCDLSFKHSGSYSAGADFGYAFPIAEKAKMGIFAGVGVSYSYLNLGVKNLTYGYEIADAELVNYTRQYNFSSIKEGLSFVDLVIPVYPSFEINLNDKLVLGIDLGVKLYLNTNTSVNPYTVNGTVSAIYEGSSKYTKDISGVISSYYYPASYMRNTYDVTAFLRTGLDYKIKDRNYLFFKLGYEGGLTSSYNSNQYSWLDSANDIYPFVYSSNYGKDIAIRSFADCISYRRSAFTIDLGYKIKF